MYFRLVAPARLLIIAAAIVVAPSVNASEARAPGGPFEVFTTVVTADELEALVTAGLDVAVAGAATAGQIKIELNMSDRDRAALESVLPDLRLELWRDTDGLTFGDRVARAHQDGYEVYRSWDEPGGIRDELDELAQAHPEIVKREVIGQSVQGRDLVALKVTKGANELADGARPAVLFSSMQHAREWIGIEVNRRLLHHVVDNYGTDDAVTRLVDSAELWFVLAVNPDGYQLTFDDEVRLWRKNLRDNNGDGEVSDGDGVDLNRNFDAHWGFDNEGSSPTDYSSTYRGPAAASEPETQALQSLLDRIGFVFHVNYHSAARLILYPVGWQDQTESADNPVFTALAGTRDNPAIEGFRPIKSATLYIANGETCDYAQKAGTMCFTPELSRPPEGGSQFVFPDDEALIEAEFQRNLPFALDVANSALDPAHPTSHLGNLVEPIYVDEFAVSYGSPQPVQANVARELGDVTMMYRVNDGVEMAVRTEEWSGGERYGLYGDSVYHRVRGEVAGITVGDRVAVWFEAGGERSEPFTFEVEEVSGARVLVLAAEDYTGITPEYEKTDGPTYLQRFQDALLASQIDADVYDIDAHGRVAPSALGVLSHYDVVLWYIGDDIVTRDEGMVAGTASRLALDTMLSVRDYLNEGGKVIYIGEYAGFQYFAGYEYDPVANAPCTPRDGSDGCLYLVNDFMQYYFGAYNQQENVGTSLGGSIYPVRALADPFAGLDFGLEVAPSGAQGRSVAFVPTSRRLPIDDFPQFASQRVAIFDRPGDKPRTGDVAIYSGETLFSYQRLMRAVDLTNVQSADLTFFISRQTREPFDAVFVEAHTAGEDDWTTLPDRNGHTASDAALSCWSSAWFGRFPQLQHYMTPAGSGRGASCDPVGTTGTWNAATGHSYGDYEEWSIDLTPYAGREIEVSITYLSSRVPYFGVLIDDVSLSTGASTSFEDGLDGWVVAGPPDGHDPNETDYVRATAADLPTSAAGPIIITEDTVLIGLGIEDIAWGAIDGEREGGETMFAEIIRRAVTYLLDTLKPPLVPIYLPSLWNQ